MVYGVLWCSVRRKNHDHGERRKTEVARKLVSEYPNLSAAEKQAVFATLKSEAELTRLRTHIDSTSGLGAASTILGL
jgi:hypothetical protein